MWFSNYQEVYIYNLKEVLDLELGETDYDWSDIFEDFRTVSGELDPDPIINSLWDKYIFPRIYGSYFIPGDSETFSREFMERWVEKAQALLDSTSQKYKPMIAAFERLKAKLGEPVEGSTEAWFNDTPQDLTASEAEDLSHVSTYNKSVTKSDMGTAAQHLADINSNVVSMYQNWANEFIIGMGVEHDEQ